MPQPVGSQQTSPMHPMPSAGSGFSWGSVSAARHAGERRASNSTDFDSTWFMCSMSRDCPARKNLLPVRFNRRALGIRAPRFLSKSRSWGRHARKQYTLSQPLVVHLSPPVFYVRENFWPLNTHFGQTSVLGVTSTDGSKPKVSFALADKPFCSDTWFHTQNLVASVSFIGGLYRDEQNTFNAPFVPELNEFYARAMHFLYDKLRIEPASFGLVIDAVDHDSFLYALPVVELIEQLFGMAGYSVKASSAGLIARQLIAKLGGLQGARVFKIPGARRLLKAHGPSVSFTKRTALQLIGSKDPNRPEAKFGDHEDLHIEARARGEKLTPDAVFRHLVEKGIFRIGADLTCPACRLRSRTPLDALKHRVVCELCGDDYDATRQLTDSNEWHYRRSGLLGREKNAQGAVPVSLTLQQLDTSLHGGLRECVYTTSLDLVPKAGASGVACEVDFVWVIPRADRHKTAIIVGECKDQGPITGDDIANLKQIADSFPRKNFETFVLLSQIAPFSDEEIEQAKTLNDEYRHRVIMLTARELEPYFIYERTKAERGLKLHGGSPEDMANATAKIYFVKKE